MTPVIHAVQASIYFRSSWGHVVFGTVVDTRTVTDKMGRRRRQYLIRWYGRFRSIAGEEWYSAARVHATAELAFACDRKRRIREAKAFVARCIANGQRYVMPEILLQRANK